MQLSMRNSTLFPLARHPVIRHPVSRGFTLGFVLRDRQGVW